MFDPKQWQVQEFQDVELVPQVERRVITMVIPIQFVIGLSTVYCRNGDTSDHDFNLTWQPGTTTEAALLFETRNVMSSLAAMLYPEMPTNPNRDKALEPLLLIGPGTFMVDMRTTVGNAAGAVMEFNLHWFQSKFAGKTSSPIVPTGATVGP